MYSILLIHVERKVVDDKRRLQSLVFSTEQIDLNGLPFVRAEVERSLRIRKLRTEIRVVCQSGQHRTGRIAKLNRQFVVSDGSRSLSCINVNPISERGLGGVGGDSHRLRKRVGMCRPPTIHPCFPGAAARWL